MNLPGVVNGGARRHRHQVRRAIGDPDSRVRQRRFHHQPREIARRMREPLVRAGDVQAGSEVVSAQMRGGDPAGSGGGQARNIQKRLGRFDHQLHAQQAGWKSEPAF